MCRSKETDRSSPVTETSRVLRDPTAVAKDNSFVVCLTDYRGVRTNTRCIFQSYMPSSPFVAEPAMPFSRMK